MKRNTITLTVLLVILVCLTFAIVSADKGGIHDLGKKTPAKVELRADPLIGLKKFINPATVGMVDVVINGQVLANAPEDSPLLDIPITQECLVYQYGTVYWHVCEVEQ